MCPARDVSLMKWCRSAAEEFILLKPIKRNGKNKEQH